MAPAPLYLACLEIRSSGLDLDRPCENPKCINPDHLELVTLKQNCERRYRK